MLGAFDARAALAVAERRRGELQTLLAELVSVSSPMGTSAAETQSVAASYLEEAGFVVERTTDDPDAYAGHADYTRPSSSLEKPVNLLARAARGTHVRLALFGHIDTEQPRDGWSASPLTPVIREGRMYGLGAPDDKGGVAASLVAAAALAGMGGPAPVVMSLHGKGGGARGSLPAFARVRDLEAALYVHPAETGRGLAEVKHVSRGVIDLTLRVEGWQGPQQEIGTPDSAAFADGGNAVQASAALVRRAREVLRDSDLNVGRVTAGERPGTVPDRCQVEFRVLFSGARTVDGILELLNRELTVATQALTRPEGRFQFSLEPSGTRTNPVAVPWDAPLCRALRNAVSGVTGAEPVSYTGHLASDIRFPVRLLGIPAVGIGCRGGNFYGPDEWVDLDDLVRLVAVIMLTAGSWHAYSSQT